MKVIFTEDDRIEEVSDGYARNYLLPKKLAALATPGNLAAAERRKEERRAELEKKRLEQKELSEKLASQEITILADSGEGGKLFGSVTAADIADAVKKKTGIDLDKKKITLGEPIKMIGEYSVSVKLFQDISAKLKIKISSS
jgi:large subunit ribosomal protein L9